MLKIFDLYLARTLLGTTFISLTVLIGLSSLIKYIEQLKNVGRGSYDFTVAGIYVLLSLPRDIEQFFPMATLIGGLIGMGMLASNSELTVMQASGMSRWQIIRSAMKTALLMVLFVMAMGEFVTPYAESKAKEIRAQAISGGSLFSSDRLTWAKDGEKFVSIGEVVDQNNLRDVNIFSFDEQHNLQSIVAANSAVFINDKWQLNRVKRTTFADTVQTFEIYQTNWQSTLTPDKLSVVRIKPEALSIRGLQDYIGYLENNSQDAERYSLALWRKILKPVTVGVMLLMALSFVFGPLRSVTMGARTIMGVITGFGFFIANEVFGPLSLVYQIPPFIGALLPSLLFALIAMQLLKRQ
ncbi:MAG: LPS export ABC transporter permease LptG [Alteromonadaceae bacterium]|nr:LPS export ABC transporter permease LptG [Alteromonadaceae bacterium]